MRRNLWRTRLQRTASREQCDSSWNESGSRMKPNVDTDVPVLGLQIEHRANEDDIHDQPENESRMRFNEFHPDF